MCNDLCIFIWSLHCIVDFQWSYAQHITSLKTFTLYQACPQAGHVQVNGEQLKLKHPMSKQRKAFRRSRSCSVKLRLEPVGALVRITGTAQLRSLVSCILTTLKHIHEHDFVHRDIRLDNVVRVTNGWLLIDWELAGRTNQLVWWEGKLLPDGVKHRIEPYTCKTDLWQLGMLIKTAAVCADVVITSFADHLLAGEFATAALAQASLW